MMTNAWTPCDDVMAARSRLTISLTRYSQHPSDTNGAGLYGDCPSSVTISGSAYEPRTIHQQQQQQHYHWCPDYLAMSKRFREKLRCKVKDCAKPVSDEDYRKEHNRKYHADLISENKAVPYERLGAPSDPFHAAE